MNLKLRLNLVTTGLLLLLMLAGIGLSFNNARNNSLAEIASAEKSTLYLLENAALAINPRKPEQIDLNAFKLQHLSHMRHLKIELVDANNKLLDSNQTNDVRKRTYEAPAWFERLLNKAMPRWQPKVKNLSFNNQLLAKLIITPDPSYEYAEIYKQITDLLVLLALFFICVNLMIAWAIAQALKPTATILSALDAIESGHLDARLPNFKLPEMARIGQKFNHMIETLQLSIHKNHQLTQQLMTLQEAERKSLARDLHDEFGQCLTAINTDASVILKRAKTQYPELKDSAQAITQLSRHLMELVSGLLQRLRPGVLDELGLNLALNDLAQAWQARFRTIQLKLNIQQPEDLNKSVLGEIESLVIYRIVQECLTNISRHAAATEVNITLSKVFKSKHLQPMQQGIALSIQDNGRGFSQQQQVDGFGLLGMRERVEGIGGDFSIESLSQTGTTIIAWIPLKVAQ